MLAMEAKMGVGAQVEAILTGIGLVGMGVVPGSVEMVKLGNGYSGQGGGGGSMQALEVGTVGSISNCSNSMTADGGFGFTGGGGGEWGGGGGGGFSGFWCLNTSQEVEEGRSFGEGSVVNSASGGAIKGP